MSRTSSSPRLAVISRCLLSALLMLFAVPSMATTMVSFQSKHYALRFEVGHVGTDAVIPVITSVQISFGDTKESPWVHSPDLKVLRSDFTAQRIEAEYTNPADASLPPSFHLSVSGSKGIIRFQGKSEQGLSNGSRSALRT